MFKKQDPNSYSRDFQLFLGQNLIGHLSAEYQVVNYENVQAKDAQTVNTNSKTQKQYVLHCSQKIVLKNPNFNNLTFIEDNTTNCFPFENYPVLLQPSVVLSGAEMTDLPNGVSLQVLDYAPKTVNSKVEISGSMDNGSSVGKSSSISNTVGSSTSETNSFGISVGLTGDIPSATANYDFAETSSLDHSQTSGNERSYGKNTDASNSSAMSIKDWAAYAYIDPQAQSPNWLFGQEYPWDVFACRELMLDKGKTIMNPNTANSNCENQLQLVLPGDMANRLYHNIEKENYLLPPSQLSQFGLSFTTKCAWLIDIDYTQTGTSDKITASHQIGYSSASHSANNNTLGVYLDNQMSILNAMQNPSVIETNIDLGIMALEVLGQADKPAIMGFLPNNFTVAPAAAPFKIFSASNTLLVEDPNNNAGSDATTQQSFSLSGNCLTTTFTESQMQSDMSIYFKVVDTVNDYNLNLKHWKGNESYSNITLIITINGDTSNQIVKYVTSKEAEGGENNLLTIALRNQDFSSTDYSDYLRLGLNRIDISISPNVQKLEEGQTSIYKLKALSIEKA